MWHCVPTIILRKKDSSKDKGFIAPANNWSDTLLSLLFQAKAQLKFNPHKPSLLDSVRHYKGMLEKSSNPYKITIDVGEEAYLCSLCNKINIKVIGLLSISPM